MVKDSRIQMDSYGMECLGNAWAFMRSHWRVLFRALGPWAAGLALAVTLTLGGPVGVVKMDYMEYAVYHEMDMIALLKYVIGSLVICVLGLIWTGTLFARIKDNPDVDSGLSLRRVQGREHVRYILQYVQFLLLFALTLGLPALLLGWLAWSVSSWFVLPLCLVMGYLSVPYVISRYAYLLADQPFLSTCRAALHEGTRLWRRLFPLIWSVCVMGIILSVAFLLPGVILKMVVYDAEVTTFLDPTSSLPSYVRILEYVCLFGGTLLVLGISVYIHSVYCLQYQLLCSYRKKLALRNAEYRQLQEEQRRLQQIKTGLRK